MFFKILPLSLTLVEIEQKLAKAPWKLSYSILLNLFGFEDSSLLECYIISTVNSYGECLHLQFRVKQYTYLDSILKMMEVSSKDSRYGITSLKTKIFN
jgi:hypothetical protein